MIMENPQHFKIIITTLILLLSSNITYATSNSASKSNTEFIKTSCTTTMYPSLCLTSLASHSSVIKRDPKLLAHVALSVAIDTAQSTCSMMVKLSKSPRGMKPSEIGPMTDCIEELTDSVEELRRSIAEMDQIKGSNFRLVMNDVQTWVSAALTDQDTCTEGFKGRETNGNLKNVVRGRILNIAHLTSNALALINNYAAIHA